MQYTRGAPDGQAQSFRFIRYLCIGANQPVHVPDSNRLPNVTGLKGPLGCLTQARYGITTEYQAIRHMLNLESVIT
jgi:hypothetical protein